MARRVAADFEALAKICSGCCSVFKGTTAAGISAPLESHTDFSMLFPAFRYPVIVAARVSDATTRAKVLCLELLVRHATTLLEQMSRGPFVKGARFLNATIDAVEDLHVFASG
jgi:hypothetical protein